ncbi:uncharacterized protein N7459_009324 [Penicillium hispanicum]|uniref:uncharacterized protein n=1 Tax=Penicillium hispanicum TaxID=1080232 RepID=UPI00254071EB|nr:uncharacterized protein N7459_009324 [Penicillium hispanicum]KAJ5569894.1 hypothetical protein N7459_009324 [Penicillium hispanicum]
MSHNLFPAPLVIAPAGKQHTHTFVLLHGKGSTAKRFGYELLNSTNLRKRLPTVKFIFPAARQQRATRFRKMPIHQWFKDRSIEHPEETTEAQLEGLSETASFLRSLIDEEARILGKGGYERIVLWGLGQGCAAGIFTLLGGWPDNCRQRTIGAFIGMSGWLPHQIQLCGILRLDNMPTDEPRDRFQDCPLLLNNLEPSQGEDDTRLKGHAFQHIRNILDLSSVDGKRHAPENSKQSPVCYRMKTPVFIGHGSVDQRVPVEHSKGMAQIISEGLNGDMVWKVYEGLEHSYRADEIDDILEFLQARVDLPTRKGTGASSKARSAM